MIRFEKKNPNLKRFKKGHFQQIISIMVLNVLLFILLTIFVDKEIAVWVAPFFWVPLMFCCVALIFMKRVNHSLENYPKEGQQEYIEFYPEYVVLCERVDTFSHHYNRCTIYYEEIERTYLYRERDVSKTIREMSIVLKTNANKSSIQNYVEGNYFTFLVHFETYPAELIDYLLGEAQEKMNTTVRYVPVSSL